jgi:hypothetical protein
VFGESERSRAKLSKFISEAEVDAMAESRFLTFAWSWTCAIVLRSRWMMVST